MEPGQSFVFPKSPNEVPFFWNIRGLTTDPFRLGLTRSILSFKIDLVIIVEPWISCGKFPAKWLSRLGLKMFAMIDRDLYLPNI